MPRVLNNDRQLESSEGVQWLDSALIAYGRAFEHPSKVRIVRWLVRMLAAGRIRVRYPRGARIVIDPSDYIGWAVFKTGYYEPASLSLALRLMTDEPGLFVDVGSNFGWYTCAAAGIAGSAVISIEPDCKNCASLRENIMLNKLQNVIVFNGAVGSDSEIVRLARRAPTNSGTGAVMSDHETSNSGDYLVSTVPLEILLKRIVRPPVRPVL
jgi:FkbM family methyltransferase